MGLFILRRLGMMLLTALCLTFIVFFMTNLYPNLEKLAKTQGNFRMSDAEVASYLGDRGYTDNTFVKFGRWLGVVPAWETVKEDGTVLRQCRDGDLPEAERQTYCGVLQGDWGYSLVFKENVSAVVWDKLANTAKLMGWVMIIMVPLALVVGVLAGMREGSGLDRSLSEAEALAGGHDEQAGRERHAVDQVAPTQPAGLLREPVDPFEPGAAHPRRRPSHLATDEAEADADPQEPRRGGDPAQAGDQALLLGRPERDEDDVRRAGGDGGLELAEVLLLVLEAEGRARGPGDAEARVAVTQDRRRALRRPLVSAQEEDAMAPHRRPGRERPDQVRPGHPLRQGRARQSARPDERHAVRDAERHARAEVAEGGVDDEATQDVEVRGQDPPAAPGAQRLVDVIHRLALRDRVELHAQQTNGRKRVHVTRPSAGSRHAFTTRAFTNSTEAMTLRVSTIRRASRPRTP